MVVAGQADGVVHLAPRKEQTLNEALQGDFRASPGLVRALSALSGPAGYVTLYRFAGSAVHAAAVVEGTAGCQRFEFFTVAPDGHADVVDAPDVIRNAKEGSMMLCGGFGSVGWTGDVGGEPVFVIEDGKNQREENTITPWPHDAWQQACTVAIPFRTPLTIDAHYCKDVDCAKGGAPARALAMPFDKDPDSLPRAEDRPQLSCPA